MRLQSKPSDMPRFMLINRDGLATRLPAPTRPYAFPRMSPDGRRSAIQGAGTDIWVYDLLRDSLTRLRLTAGATCRSRRPSGRSITFVSARDGTPSLYSTNADGSGGERRVTAGNVRNAHAFTPDGGSVVTARAEPDAAGVRLWLVRSMAILTPVQFCPKVTVRN